MVGLATVLAGVSIATAPNGAPVAAGGVADSGAPLGRGSMDSSTVAFDDLAPASRSGRARSRPPGAEGWTEVVDLLPGTQMVALTWDRSEEGPDAAAVSIRSRQGDTWSEWTHQAGCGCAACAAAAEENTVGDKDVRDGTGVVWLGSEGADAVEVRVDKGPLEDLELLRMRYHEGQPLEDGESAGAPSGDARSTTGRSARPTIRPRGDWATRGWRSDISGCGSAPTVAPNLRHAVVHHSVNTNTYTQAQAPGLIEGIREYHTNGQRWCDIAYNFVVDRFGTIWQGRAGDITQPVVGGHAAGFNTGSVGVVLLGQFQPGATPAAAQPSAAMMDSTARLIAWKLSLHGLNPQGNVTVISGQSTRYPAGTSVTLPVINTHQTTSTTSCPGDNVISRMASLREAVAGYMSTSPGNPGNPDPPGPEVPADWAPFNTVQDLVWRQYMDFRRDPATYEERLWWADNLNSGATSRDALVAALTRAPRTESASSSIIRLYLAYYRRLPDSAGLRYWWARYDSGRGIRSISSDFAFAQEFRTLYGGLSDEQFVRLVYRNVIGREGEPAGIAYWTGELRNRRENRGGVMTQMSESAENRTRQRDVVDVILVHQVMLNRMMTSSAHMTWVARVQAEGIGSLSRTLFASSEYAARFN